MIKLLSDSFRIGVYELKFEPFILLIGTNNQFQNYEWWKSQFFFDFLFNIVLNTCFHESWICESMIFVLQFSLGFFSTQQKYIRLRSKSKKANITVYLIKTKTLCSPLKTTRKISWKQNRSFILKMYLVVRENLGFILWIS